MINIGPVHTNQNICFLFVCFFLFLGQIGLPSTQKPVNPLNESRDLQIRVDDWNRLFSNAVSACPDSRGRAHWLYTTSKLNNKVYHLKWGPIKILWLQGQETGT